MSRGFVFATLQEEESKDREREYITKTITWLVNNIEHKLIGRNGRQLKYPRSSLLRSKES